MNAGPLCQVAKRGGDVLVIAIENQALRYPPVRAWKQVSVGAEIGDDAQLGGVEHAARQHPAF